MAIAIRGRRMKMSSDIVDPVEPVDPSEAKEVLKSIFDNVFFMDKALNRAGTPAANGDFITSVPSDKGGKVMEVTSLATPRTEMMKYNPKMGGLVNLDNENIFFLRTPGTTTITAPCEVHFTGLRLFPFKYESYINVGMYLADYDGSLRTTNANDTDSIFSGANFPLYKPFQCRMVFTATKRVEIYINGVKLPGDKKTYYTGLSTFFTALGLGTNTNNAKWFASSMMHINRLLTTEEASQVYTALKTIYSTEVDIPYPVMKGITINTSGNNVNAARTYSSPTGTPENVSLRKERWYAAGNNPAAADVTNNRRITALDNLSTWSKVTFADLVATDIWFRYEVECTDINGITFGSAAGCGYIKIA